MAQSNGDGTRDILWDEVAERFNQQPRPNDYADDAGYDDAAGNFIDEFVDFILADRKQHELEARKEQIMQDWNSLDNFCDHHDESEELAWRDSRLKELGQS